jgi:hypothetical protein
VRQINSNSSNRILINKVFDRVNMSFENDEDGIRGRTGMN